jgi:16S rRNA (adenine1518-N6/adenine1519-N6)-dimethyltransferase
VNPIPDPRALLAKHGLYAKKSWGQNFLVDRSVYQAIVTRAVKSADEWIVEIGAGLGTLTLRLADAVPDGRVLAVERDRDLVAVLTAELGERPNVEVCAENAMTYSYAEAARRARRPLVVVGNLPYQIASQLLFGMLEARRHIVRALVMLQKEMADRLLAKPDTSAYGAFGVLLSTYFDIKPVVRARAGAFFPPPRVDSAVVELVPLPGFGPRVPLSNEALYRECVHAAFGQRRKTLRNALRARFPDEVVARALAQTGIDGQRRGETLSLEEFAGLAREVERAGAA